MRDDLAETLKGRQLTVAWCHSPEYATELTRLFVANAQLSYISHSELMFGRAVSLNRWSDDLEVNVYDEISSRLREGNSSVTKILVARLDQQAVGVALVLFNLDVPIKHYILEDIIVDSAVRGIGIGQKMLDWIRDDARGRGVHRAFLESGRDNPAHSFFHRNGFHQTSIVMMSDFGPAENTPSER